MTDHDNERGAPAPQHPLEPAQDRRLLMRLRPADSVRRSPWLDYSEEITRGAALMDYLAPGWFHHIDIDRLSLANARTCILGQAVIHEKILPLLLVDEDDDHDYDTAAERLRDLSCNGDLDPVEKEHGTFDPYAYGFNVNTYCRRYRHALLGLSETEDLGTGRCDCPDQIHDKIGELTTVRNSIPWMYEQLTLGWLEKIESRKLEDWAANPVYTVDAVITHIGDHSRV